MFQAEDERYPYIPTVRQTGIECFKLGDQILPVNLLSFWQWSASDLVGNTARGCLAEYIVAMALGLTAGVRKDWEAYDLQCNGWKIEVKTSAYLQSWVQRRMSPPVFSVRPARRWNPMVSRLTGELRRHADLYIFCLHHHKEKATLNPLDLTQWTFYVLPTGRLESFIRVRNAKTLSIASLLTLAPDVVPFTDLGNCINKVISHIQASSELK
jgi:hypothetical protein